MKSIICTLGYKANVIINTVKMFGGDKLFIFHGVPNERVSNEIKKVKDAIPSSFIPSQFIQVDHYDIVSIIKKVRKIINQEYLEGNTIFVNISSGRKTLAFGTQLACYIEYNKINRLFYLTEEKNELIDIPILIWEITEPKKDIIDLINRGVNNLKDIAYKMGLSNSMTYKHINELINENYINKENDFYVLTLKGKMIARNLDDFYQTIRISIIKQLKNDPNIKNKIPDKLEKIIQIRSYDKDNDKYIEINKEITNYWKCPRCKNESLKISLLKIPIKSGINNIKQVKCSKCKLKFNIRII